MRFLLHGGFRLLRTRPLFSASIITSLAVGIAATAAVFGVLDKLLVRPLSFPDAGRIVFVSNAWPLFLDASDGEPTARRDALASLAQYEVGRVSVGRNELRVAHVARVTREFFRVLGVAPRAGNLANDNPLAPSEIVLGATLAGQLAGNGVDAVGQSVIVNGREFVVRAVMPTDFVFHVRGEPVEAWVPWTETAALVLTAQQTGDGAIARIRDDLSIATAHAHINATLEAIGRQRPELRLDNAETNLVPLRDYWFGPLRTPLLLLLGAGACLLLIACANTSGLLLSRAAARQNDIAIRAILGASRVQLVREALGETIVLAACAAIVALVLSNWGAAFLLSQSPVRIVGAEQLFSYRVLGFVFLTAFPAAALSGWFAAWHVSRADLSRGMGAGMRQGLFMASRARRVLVGVQVAITVLLLVNAGVLLRSFRALRFESTGFDPRNVLTLEIAPLPTRFPDAATRLAYYQQILRRVQQAPGVQHAGLVNFLPIHSGSYIMPVTIPDAPPAESPTWSYRAATPDYFRAMRIPLLAGRMFAESDVTNAKRVAIIDRSAAVAIIGNNPNLESAIGRTMRISSSGEPLDFEIVGVVGDIRQQGLGIPSYPGFYLSAYQRTAAVMNLVVRSSLDAIRLTEIVGNTLRSVDASIPLGNMGMLDARVSDTVARRRFAVLLSGVLSASALLLSMVGLFALMSQLTVHRTHEIGVRIALGARAVQIMRLVLREGLVIAGIGVAAGLIATLGSAGLLGGLLYGVQATDPATFVIVPLAVLLLAGVSCGVPAVRAMRVSPMDALRRD